MVGLPLVLVALAGWGVAAFRRATDRAFTHDAVLCASMRVSRLYLENPTPSEKDIEDCLVELKTASITHVRMDRNGKPVDLYGTPFRLRRELREGEQTVSATSAGPDRRFDTEDDVRAVTTTEFPYPRKR